MNYKLLAIAFAAIICTSSCHDLADDKTNTDGMLTFATQKDAKTRGSSITGDAGANPLLSMGVFAFYNTNHYDTSDEVNYMNNIQLSRASSAAPWGYTNVDDTRYWVPTGFHSFFAYAPFGAATPTTTGLNTESLSPKIELKYTVNQQVHEHIDLLFSASTHLNKTKAIDENNPILFDMKHALAKISFELKLGPNYATSPVAGFGACKLKSLEIRDVNDNGTLKYTLVRSGGGTTAVDGVLGAEWKLTTNTTKIKDIKTQGIPDNALTETMQDMGTWFMLPQKIQGRGDMLKPKLYAIFEFANNEIRALDFDLTTLSSEWLMGQAIKYSITYDGTGFTPSSVTGTVVPWDNQEVDGNLHGTYLNLSQDSAILIPTGITSDVFYETDYTGVTIAKLDGTTDITITQAGRITLPSGITAGIHTLKITAGKLNRTLKIRKLSVTAITDTRMANSYVGEFWRASQTGERIIRIANTQGAWSAKVVHYGAGWGADRVLFSNTLTADANVNFGALATAADMNNPVNDKLYGLNNGKDTIGGVTTTPANGYIYFRMGITAPNLTAEPRYAVVELRYANNTKSQLLYIRQGDQAGQVSKNSDVEWSPYNVVPTGSVDYPGATDKLTAYPSQAGWFKNHSKTTNLWSPYLYPGTGGWTNEASSTINSAICPTGYAIPSSYGQSSTVTNINKNGGNELGSLFNNTNAGNSKHIWGYYADGYFDRHAITGVTSGDPYGNATNTTVPSAAVKAGSNTVAYQGYLFVDLTNFTSLFMPGAGIRAQHNGQLGSAGNDGVYWCRSYSTTSIWDMGFNATDIYQTENNPANYGFSVRCVRQ